jgi:hypothetical protein
MTPSGIEPATFRFVAQYLNYCATISVPYIYIHTLYIYTYMYTYIHIYTSYIFYGRTGDCRAGCVIWRYASTMWSASGRAVRRQTMIFVLVHLKTRTEYTGFNCFSTTYSNGTHFMRSFCYIMQFLTNKTQTYYIIVCLTTGQ